MGPETQWNRHTDHTDVPVEVTTIYTPFLKGIADVNPHVLCSSMFCVPSIGRSLMISVDLKSRGESFILLDQKNWLISWGSLNYSKSYPMIHPWPTIIEPGNLEAERNFIPKRKRRWFPSICTGESLGSYHLGNIFFFKPKVLTDGIVLCKDELGEPTPGKLQGRRAGVLQLESSMTISAGNKVRLNCLTP